MRTEFGGRVICGALKRQIENMKENWMKTAIKFCRWYMLPFLFASATPALGGLTEIVSLQGKGEYREPSEPHWREVSIRQKLAQGSFVRTGDTSRMAALLDGQTQIRLAANSMLQIKQIGDNRDRCTGIKKI